MEGKIKGLAPRLYKSLSRLIFAGAGGRVLEPIFSISSDNQPSSWRPSPNDTLEHDQSMLMVKSYMTEKKFFAPLTSSQLDRWAVGFNSHWGENPLSLSSCTSQKKCFDCTVALKDDGYSWLEEKIFRNMLIGRA